MDPKYFQHVVNTKLLQYFTFLGGGTKFSKSEVYFTPTTRPRPATILGLNSHV